MRSTQGQPLEDQRHEEREFLSGLSEIEEEILATFSDEDRPLFLRFLRDTRKNIFSDYMRASAKYKQLLKKIKIGLIDSKFKIGHALEECQICTTGDYSLAFCRLTNKRPNEYLSFHRSLLAQKILQTTGMRRNIHLVAYAVGYNSRDTLTRNYKRVMGYTPRKERQATKEEIVDLLQELTGCAPSAKLSDPRVSPNTTEDDVESAELELTIFWNEIKDLKRDEIMAIIKRRLETFSLGHYHYLIEKAKYAGRRDRKKSIEVIGAAIDILKSVELVTGQEYPDEKAISYAKLGNEYRLIFEYQKARSCFRRAVRYLPSEHEDNPLLYERVMFMKVSLLWCQRHIDESIELLQKVIPTIRKHGSKQLLARALIVGGEIYDSTGRSEIARPWLEEGVGLGEFIDDPYVVLSTNYNLTLVFTKLSMANQAACQFEQVRKLYRGMEGEVSKFHIIYLDGAVLKVCGNTLGAEKSFRQARDGFVEQKMDIYAALVSLDLALLYLDLRRNRDALRAATFAIPPVAQYTSHHEAIAALTVLQEAEGRGSISERAIKTALDHLDLVRKNPNSSFIDRAD